MDNYNLRNTLWIKAKNKCLYNRHFLLKKCYFDYIYYELITQH